MYLTTTLPRIKINEEWSRRAETQPSRRGTHHPSVEPLIIHEELSRRAETQPSHRGTQHHPFVAPFILPLPSVFWPV